MYTRNLDLTIYHCKKAFCYYVEFIGQIGDDNHTYLQLNSKDATLFVYKKTIFEIDNEYRKKFELSEDDKIYMKLLTNIIDIFHEIILTMISKEPNLKICVQTSNTRNSTISSLTTAFISSFYSHQKTCVSWQRLMMIISHMNHGEKIY